MEEAFELPHLYPYVDIALINKNYVGIHPLLKDKAFEWNAKPKEVVERLRTAQIVFIHPDGFDKWTDILFYLVEKTDLPFRLVIIAGSDFAVGDEHMEPFLHFFPNTEFWIMNYCGTIGRCKLLPIGTNGQAKCLLKKTKPLSITYCKSHIGNQKRKEFSEFIDKHSDINKYQIKECTKEKYYDALSESYFSTCPMGEGFDTLRFWETLMVDGVPIVKDHVFYDTLMEQYPDLPLMRLKSWEELVDLLPTLSEQRWKEILEGKNKYVCKKKYWINELCRFTQINEAMIPEKG